MKEHPMYSDSDNLVRNYQDRIDELERENERLCNANKAYDEFISRGRKKRISKGIKPFVMLAVSMIGAICIISKKESRLDGRCTALCSKAIDKILASGRKVNSEGCSDLHSRCVCRLRGGFDVRLPFTTNEELFGDLDKITAKMDIEKWWNCMAPILESPVHVPSDTMCRYIPLKREFVYGRQKIKKSDGGSPEK